METSEASARSKRAMSADGGATEEGSTVVADGLTTLLHAASRAPPTPERNERRRTPSAEAGGDVAGEVGQDQVGARSLDRYQRLHHETVLVEPAPLGRRLDHGVLTRHLIGRHREFGP